MYIDAVGSIGNILFQLTFSPSAFESALVSWNYLMPR